jgi:four helix bundle protein
MAFDAAMKIFEITKGFPNEEKYSLVDQTRRSSRSVCSNLAEAWRKRKYVAVFKNKLTDSMPALLNRLRSKDVLHLCASK